VLYSNRRFTNNLVFPYIAFNPQGQLIPRPSQLPRDEFIPLAKGSIFVANNGLPDVVETPAGNHTNNVIQINWLTGRAKVVPRELP
jgi:hypothetical protein